MIAQNGLALSALVAGVAVNSELIAPTRVLAERLVNLAISDPLPLFVPKDRSPRADLATYVYTAAGLFDWWQLTAQDEILDLVADLLMRAKAIFYKNGVWDTNGNILTGSNHGKVAIKDDQVPSPTAEWFRLANALTFAESKFSQQFAGDLDRISKTWSNSMRSEAFFHGTIISAMVTRKWLTNSDYGNLDEGAPTVAKVP